MNDWRSRIDVQSVLDFAIPLIETPTQNPPGREHTLAERVSNWLADMGFCVEQHPSPTGRPNVVATMGTGSHLRIWSGHLDTVPAGDASRWVVPAFKATVKHGRLYGRGAADMKGAIGACLAGAQAMRKAGVEPLGRTQIHLVSDEETLGLQGAGHLATLGLLSADGCMVGEPTGMGLGIAERGALWAKATTFGRAAHGSQPWTGVSAIEMMCRLIEALPTTLPRTTHPLAGQASVNVGTISGGTKVNMVPEVCQIEIDRRTLPGEDLAECFARLADLVDSVTEPLGEGRLELIGNAQSFELESQAELAQAVRGIVSAVIGRMPQDVAFSGFTDARYYAAEGTPTILFGPGDIAEAHATNESVSLTELLQASAVYATWLTG